MTPEGVLKAKCRKIARDNGLFFWNVEGKGINGIPDTLCSKKGGGIVFIEFKRPDGTGVVSVQQHRRIAELRAAGAEAEVVDNVEAFKWFVGL